MNKLKLQSGLESYFNYAFIFFLASFILLPSTKAVNNFYYIFMAMPALIVLLSGKSRWPEKNRLTLSYGLFLAYLLIRGALEWDLDPYKNILYVALFSLIVLVWVDVEKLEQPNTARFLFWSLIIYVLSSTVFYWITGRLEVGERFLLMPGRLSGPILTGMLIVSCLALMLCFDANRRRTAEMFIAVAAAVFIVAFVLQSRTGLVGLLFLFVAGCIWLFIKAEWWLRGIMFLMVVVMLFVVGWLYESSSLMASLVERGDAGRFELWALYLKEWVGCSVWLGCGSVNPPDIYRGSGEYIHHPHNLFINNVFYYGLFALLIFVFTIAQVLLAAWRQKNPWGVYLLFSLLMLSFDGGNMIDSPNEMWLLLLFPILQIIARHTKSAGEKRQPNASLTR